MTSCFQRTQRGRCDLWFCETPKFCLRTEPADSDIDRDRVTHLDLPDLYFAYIIHHLLVSYSFNKSANLQEYTPQNVQWM